VASGEIEHGDPPTYRKFQPDEDVLRALLSASWLNLLHNAFFLRPNDIGLSVCYDCTPDRCLDVLSDISAVHGVAALKVQQVAALGLSVTADSPNHAQIEGLPHKESDSTRAEWFARRLAEAATIVDKTKRRRPKP
jgi:hypothetical protein